MKTGDGLKATWMALINAMKTDTRFTVDEQAALAAIYTLLNGGGDTSKQQDLLVVTCMQKYVCQNPNY